MQHVTLSLVATAAISLAGNTVFAEQTSRSVHGHRATAVTVGHRGDSSHRDSSRHSHRDSSRHSDRDRSSFRSYHGLSSYGYDRLFSRGHHGSSSYSRHHSGHGGAPVVIQPIVPGHPAIVYPTPGHPPVRHPSLYGGRSGHGDEHGCGSRSSGSRSSGFRYSGRGWGISIRF